MDWRFIIGSSLVIGAIIGALVGLYFEMRTKPRRSAGYKNDPK